MGTKKIKIDSDYYGGVYRSCLEALKRLYGNALLGAQFRTYLRDLSESMP
jgi:hypothetical protein